MPNRIGIWWLAGFQLQRSAKLKRYFGNIDKTQLLTVSTKWWYATKTYSPFKKHGSGLTATIGNVGTLWQLSTSYVGAALYEALACLAWTVDPNLQSDPLNFWRVTQCNWTSCVACYIMLWGASSEWKTHHVICKRDKRFHCNVPFLNCPEYHLMWAWRHICDT